MEITKEQLKSLAKNLYLEIKDSNENIKYSYFLESFAHTLGFCDFNNLSKKFINENNEKKKQKITYKKFISNLKKSDFNYLEYSNHNNEVDKNIYIESIDMTLFDFCNIYFKRTFEKRKYYPNAEIYFDLSNLKGERIISIYTCNPDEIKKTSFFIIKNERKIRNEYGFEVIFYTENSNIVLYYAEASHFLLDFIDFINKSDLDTNIRRDELKEIFLHILSIEKPLTIY